MGDTVLPPLRLAEIRALACTHFGVALAEMRSGVRDRRVARARQAALHLAQRFTLQSKAAIGRFFGRDHTTVIYASMRAIELQTKDPEFRDQLAALERELLRRAMALAEHPACDCGRCSSAADRFPLDPPQIPLPMDWPGELALQGERIAA